MGGWLERLKTEKAPPPHPTKPTKPPQGGEVAGFVGFVGCPPATIPKNEGGDGSCKPQAEPGRAVAEAGWDSDRWCWPHTKAMNTGEIDAFTARLALFTDKGLTLGDAEQLADALLIRDREGDDRRLCLECLHLGGGHKARTCSQWRRAGLGGAGVPADMVMLPQRCDGFR